MALYLPARDEISSVALHARLRNPLASARVSIQRKIAYPPADWDARTVLSVPGIVWTVSSDTCATGRLSAPENVAYDHCGREFVFRQPANEVELGAIMSAESEEVFACYRFDGLSRWTSRSVGAWIQDMEVVLGYVRHVLMTDADAEIVDGLAQYEAYLTSSEFSEYIGEFQRQLERRG